MNKQNIQLINAGNFECDLLDYIAQEVAQEFNYLVEVIESDLDINKYYDPARRQFDGNKLLNAINLNSSVDTVKRIGLFNVDLFIPILTYIFGQAALKGNIGIASAYRLRNELYGLKKDDDLLLNRFSKVIIHELGHTFGLIHCNAPKCVMRSSTYVEDIDQKSKNFCSTCRLQIEAI